VIVHRPDVIPSEAIEQFSQEAETMRAALGLLLATSRELVHLHDHGVHVVPHEHAALPLGFAVREELSGQSLAKVIAAHGGFGVPVARARRLAGHVARGLFAMHEVGVLHRDLTPTNVLIVQENGQERAKLVDYAFAAALAPHAIEPSSVGYAPPERFVHPGAPIGPASDVFSFAVILFEALSGTEAFSRGDPMHVSTQMVKGERPALARVRATLPAELRDKPELVAALDREIGRATKPDPAQRHASIRELWGAL
jgi:serine/threonine-protein kinase